MKEETIVLDDKLVTAFFHEGFLDSGLNNLAKKGLKPADSRDLAKYRIKCGTSTPIWSKRIVIGENINYMPNGDVLISSLEYNPAFVNVAGFVEAHKGLDEFYLEGIVDDLLARSSEDPDVALMKGVLYLPRKDVPDRIAWDDLDNHPLTKFLFEVYAKEYGKALKDLGFDSIPFHCISETGARDKNRPFARLLWLGSFSLKSDITGDYAGMGHVNVRLMGLRVTDSSYDGQTIVDKK